MNNYTRTLFARSFAARSSYIQYYTQYILSTYELLILLCCFVKAGLSFERVKFSFHCEMYGMGVEKFSMVSSVS